ncbi:hypothetical protein [Rhodoblastus sp.]|uniref:hypothetical protein n=1 Tax=Rhodoblastus sp. TaxID=1962975 RepID=UPI003F9E217B
MVRNGLKLEPEEIGCALDWLRINPQDDELPLKTAAELGRQLRAQGGDRRSKDFQGDTITLKRGSTGAPYITARLERDADGNPQAAELLAQVRAKRLAPTAAARAMGWRKPPLAP